VHVTVSQWPNCIASLYSHEDVPAAMAGGRLLAGAENRWERRVVARTSMHDLLFTLPGEPYPFAHEVRVFWDEVFRVPTEHPRRDGHG